MSISRSSLSEDSRIRRVQATVKVINEDCRIRRVRRRVAGCAWLSLAFRVGCGWLALAGGDGLAGAGWHWLRLAGAVHHGLLLEGVVHHGLLLARLGLYTMRLLPGGRHRRNDRKKEKLDWIGGKDSILVCRK